MDLPAVIRNRVDQWADAAGSERQAGKNIIAGLIPRAVGVTDTDMARGLERASRGVATPGTRARRTCH